MDDGAALDRVLSATPAGNAGHRWVLHAPELYALPILRPLAAAAGARGQQVAWLTTDRIAERLQPGEHRLRSQSALAAFKPHAVFATVNRIPPFFPGAQVQLFHGLNLHKRDPKLGQFRIQNLFDLYCTHGPATTGPLLELARQHANFAVIETGWPKLDPLFMHPETETAAARPPSAGLPLVLYASTFNEPLSCAQECLPVLKTLIQRGDRQWLLTLHPLCPAPVQEAFRQLGADHGNATFIEPDRLIDALRCADVLVCDTSSVVEEFILLRKPVVTLRHRDPQPFMRNVNTPEEMDAAISAALAEPLLHADAAARYAGLVHPRCDAQSAARVLDATEHFLAYGSPLVRFRRPRTRWRRWWRSRKMMRELFPDSRTLW